MSATDELEHYMTACSRLKTDNARLQAALDETHGRGVWLWSQLQATATAIVQLTIDGIHFLERERDGYKALAKLRREEILKSGEDCCYCGRWHHFSCRHVNWARDESRTRCIRYPCSSRCKEARAAIDATSEEAREKEEKQ
ncbi:hypothetical protein LCGC14_0442990 [marine sediment metagenome]|uniref:Uncharacterized protein n=1 Tax=marine sediment metagenome TaxID=412755 RepID=A0A0F9SR17_9ZZZZ